MHVFNLPENRIHHFAAPIDTLMRQWFDIIHLGGEIAFDPSTIERASSA